MLLLPAKLLRPSGTEPCPDSSCVCAALFSPIMLTWLALIIGGGVVASRAESRIKRGVRDQIWQEDELASLQTWIDRPLTRVVAVLPVLGLAGFLIADPDHRLTVVLRMLFIFLLPTLTLSRWSVVLRPVQQGLTQDWRTWKPLQSGHWGERRAPGENSMR